MSVNVDPKNWHATLPVQKPWTIAVTDCAGTIACPGNHHSWIIAEIKAGDPEQAKAYTHLMGSALEMHDALESMIVNFRPKAVSKFQRDAIAQAENALALSEGRS